MQSIDLIRENLERSAELVLMRIEDMKDHCLVFPTARRRPGTDVAVRRPTRARGWALLALALLPGVAHAQEAGRWDRGHFTLLLNLGVGFQRDGFVDQTETALAGLNLGIGGFLADDVALMFRASGTTGANYGSYVQTSGVGAPVVQYWIDDRLAIEAGVGFGFWNVDNPITGSELWDSGLGLIMGAGYTLFGSGKHAFRLGIEYAPAFTEPDWVHNVGLVLGWQLL